MVKSKKSATGAARTASFDDFLGKYGHFQFGRWEIMPTGPEQIDMSRQGLNGSSNFQLWLEFADDYGTAEVVGDDEFDRLVAGGAVQVFRGMPDSRTTGAYKLEQVMYGEKYYTGRGIFGDGLYFAENIDVAGYYATNFASAGDHGSVMRAVVKPSARMGDYFDVAHAMAEEYPNMIRDDAAISAYARSRGYDILTSDHGGGKYYTVLNRGALVFNEVLGTASTANGGTEIVFDTARRG